MPATDWDVYRCNNAACMQVGHDIRVASGISTPHCCICGFLLSPLAGAIEDSEMPSMKPVDPPMTLEEADEVTIGPMYHFDVDPGCHVTEWMRCRDGIDTAEIALKGFCDEIGADMTKGRIQALCRELQDLVHTHYGLGD